MKEKLECKTQKEIRKYFANGKKFVIRIRKEGDILYYKGIKILDISNSALTVSNNIFQLNKACMDNAIKSAKKDSDLNQNLEEKVKKDILSNIDKMRQEMFNKEYLLIDKDDCNIKIERNKVSQPNFETEGLNKILEYLNNRDTFNIDIEYAKKYKFKKRKELSLEKNRELDKSLREFVELQKEKLSKKLGDKLNFYINYTQKMQTKSEKELEVYPQDKKSKIENTWNKEYIISYTLSPNQSLERKKGIQEILCDEEIFNDAAQLDNNHFEFEDSIIYHLNVDTSNEKLTESELQEIADIEYEIIRNRIYDEDLKYHKVSKPTFSTIKGKSFLIKDINSFKDIDNITEEMEDKVKKYIKFVKEEVEKHYQFQFMIQDETKQKIKNAILKDPSIKDATNQIIYPFEQELFILNQKGRIDSIFFGIKEKTHTADLYLIELKVNESVIGGKNGVHKHLSDICELLSQEKIRENFLYNSKDALLKVLKYRLNELDEDKFKTIEKFDTIHFWTIVGYTSKEHKETSEELLDFYYSHNPIDQKETKKQLNNLKSKYNSLKDINISIPKSSKPLIDYIDELNKQCTIPIDVKFFLDPMDKDYHISAKEFELLDFKSNTSSIKRTK